VSYREPDPLLLEEQAARGVLCRAFYWAKRDFQFVFYWAKRDFQFVTDVYGPIDVSATTLYLWDRWGWIAKRWEGDPVQNFYHLTERGCEIANATVTFERLTRLGG